MYTIHMHLGSGVEPKNPMYRGGVWIFSVERKSLSADILSTLRMKGHVLHCARAHLKVPRSSLVWNALLSKK